jgi:putative phage-type endonuclease
MPLDAVRLEQRREGLGGSDVAAALGLSPWKTPYQLWREKRGLDKDERDGPRLRLGKKLEDVIANEFAEASQLRLQRVNTMLRSQEFPWMVANIDRAVVNTSIAGRVSWAGGRLTTDAILEAKLVSTWASHQWGEEGTDEVPLYYLTQGVHYLIVTGVEVCHFAAFVDGNTKRYKLVRDPELIEMVIEGEREFMRMVESGTEPPMTTPDDVAIRYFKDAGSSVEATPEIAQQVLDHAAWRAKLDEAQSHLDAIKLEIKKYMGEAAILTYGGKPVVTWKSPKASNRFDLDAFKDAHPSLVAEFTREVSNSRRMLFK